MINIPILVKDSEKMEHQNFLHFCIINNQQCTIKKNLWKRKMFIAPRIDFSVV